MLVFVPRNILLGKHQIHGSGLEASSLEGFCNLRFACKGFDVEEVAGHVLDLGMSGSRGLQGLCVT